MAAYYFTYKGVVTVDFIESIYNARGVTFTGISNYLISYFSPSTLDKMIQDSFNANATDTVRLKASISDILLNGKKLILITESQGNFFGKQAIQDFLNGERLNSGGKTGRINDFWGTIGQLQIAPPTGSLFPKNKVVLNDRDIINLVFFEKPDSNFTLIPPSPDLRSVEIDRFANHFITSTYLNTDNMTTGNLSSLRDFTLQSVVDLASSLESNCPKAVINYTKNNLIVNFDSTDPEDPDVKDLTYTWDFGDGQILDTKSKIFSHTYTQAGAYNVTLTVTDNYGASDTITVELIVALRAVINYTKNNLVVNFDSTDPEDPNAIGLTYAWSFGDGQTASTTSKTFSHNYSAEGTYNVILTVTDIYGSSNTTNLSLAISDGKDGTATFCNMGNGSTDNSMNVSVASYSSFDIGFQVISNIKTCECKTIELPKPRQDLGENFLAYEYTISSFINGTNILYNGVFWLTTFDSHFSRVFGIGRPDPHQPDKLVIYPQGSDPYNDPYRCSSVVFNR